MNAQEGISMLRQSGAVKTGPMVEVTIAVPLSDLDFSQCPRVEKVDEDSEFWGTPYCETGYYCDIDDVEWNGHAVTLSDHDYELAKEHRIQEFING